MARPKKWKLEVVVIDNQGERNKTAHHYSEKSTALSAYVKTQALCRKSPGWKCSAVLVSPDNKRTPL